MWNWLGIRKKTQNKREGLVGISETAKGLAMAYYHALENGIPQIESYEYLELQNLTEKEKTLQKQTALNNFVAAHQLQGVVCSYVLSSKDYVLTLIETPKVAKGEVGRALQWLVKDLINFPETEAILDTFELPLPRARDNVRMSYVTIIRQNLIPAIETLVNSSGLLLSIIDIPELALRNIAARLPENDHGMVVVWLNPLESKLIIYKESNILFSRNLDLDLEQLTGDSASSFEQLGLEIQRSLDYTNSTFKQPPISTVVLTPSEIDKELIKNALIQNLGLQCHDLELANLIHSTPKMEEKQEAQVLLAVGAALREAA